MNPEYTLIFDLIDTYEVPLPDFPVTRPGMTQGITNIADIMNATRANPRGIIASNPIGYINSKSKFFEAVELLRPMIPGDVEIIEMGENRDSWLSTNETGVGRVRKPRYRINLVAWASQGGQPLLGVPVLPFSNLFHTFDAYNNIYSAQMAYDQALAELERFASHRATQVPHHVRRMLRG